MSFVEPAAATGCVGRGRYDLPKPFGKTLSCPNLAVVTAGRATIRDVARRAGVSPTTVSHVLSGQGRVHAETRRRVHEAVRDLGYRANPLARNLRHDRFGAIGLYLPHRSLSLQFYVDLALAASQAAFAHRCGLTLLPPVTQPSDVLQLPLDGVIVAEPVVDDPLVAALAEAGTPLVLCEAADHPSGVHVSVIDNQHEPTFGELLDHLVARGAREIAVVGGEDTVWWGRLTRRATESWSTRTGHPVRWVAIPLACEPYEARAAVDSVLDEAVPDALVIGQQGLAGAALASIGARGLSVPGDLLVACGVDGPDLLTTTPHVTALDLHPESAGEIAAAMLFGECSERIALLRPTLVIRASTG